METFSALLAICAGNSPVTGEFFAQRPVTQSFDVFFDLSLNKRSSKQSWCWWFETSSRLLWRHCNEGTRPPPVAGFPTTLNNCHPGQATQTTECAIFLVCSRVSWCYTDRDENLLTRRPLTKYLQGTFWNVFSWMRERESERERGMGCIYDVMLC